MNTINGKKVLLTAGPTYEAIDPVRFIGNHSTGKMGYALAECFASQGATVFLISGPTNLQAQHPNIQVTPVTSAQDMYEAAAAKAPEADIWVFAAAVADYRPKSVSETKIKKNSENLTIELTKNVDIAATLGKLKKPGQFSIGFALETDNELDNARQKLLKKNFNMVVLNSLRDSGAGFKHDTNKITLVEKDKITTFDLKPKAEVAQDIVKTIAEKLHV